MGSFTYTLSQFTQFNRFTTEGLFDDNYVHSNKSAIDDFVDKRTELFKLIWPYRENIANLPGELTKMILLGCISAVESYIRKIIRSIIIVDHASKKCCEERTLKYGAVVAHKDKSMLPEALFENISFTSGKHIKETISSFLNVKCDNNQNLSMVLMEYSSVCELRHCVVHRFGLLGSSNAIRLGLSEHVKYIEKPIQIDFDRLNGIVQICNNLVKAVNSHLFAEIIERTFVERTESWSNYRKDKKTFKKYLDIFIDSTNPLDYRMVYNEFLNCMHSKHGAEYQKPLN